MIRGILNKWGYIHESEITDDFCALRLAEAVGDPMEYSIEPKEEEAMFKDLSNIEHLPAYLTATLARDMQRSFASPEDQRQLVRGAFARTADFRTKIRNINQKVIETKSADNKLKGLRYG